MSSQFNVFQKAIEGRRSVFSARLNTWWVARTPDGKDPVVCIMCPVCERSFHIKTPWSGHTIHADGTVTPSIVCPNQRKLDRDVLPCGFHVMGKLDSWEPLPEYAAVP